jgi:DNA-binding beta-propeller fold protein YncE
VIRARACGRSRVFRVVLLGIIAGARAAGTTPPDSGYHLVDTIRLGGGEASGQLALDLATHRLFVPRSTGVTVVDVRDGRQLGDIKKTSGVHGVALAPALTRGFTSNGAANTVTIFDPRTLIAASDQPQTGASPEAIVYDPGSGRVFTMNAGSNNATAIVAVDGTAAGTVPLGDRPGLAVSDGAGRVFVDLPERNEIAVFDARLLRVVRRWPVAPCAGTLALAIDTTHKRLFVACRNGTMAALDTRNGRVVATLPIGHAVDVIRYDPATALVLVVSGDGTLTVAHQDSPDAYRIVDVITTPPGARAMELDPSTHRLYLAAREEGPADRRQRSKAAGSLVLLVYDR